MPNSIVSAQRFISHLAKRRKLAKLLPREGRNFRKTTRSGIFQSGANRSGGTGAIELWLGSPAGQVRAERTFSARRGVDRFGFTL